MWIQINESCWFKMLLPDKCCSTSPVNNARTYFAILPWYINLVYLEPASLSPRCLFVSALENWMDRTFCVCMYMYNICIYCISYVYNVYIFSSDPGTVCWQPCEPDSSANFPSSSLLSIYLVHNSSACLEGSSDVKDCPKPCWKQDKHPWLSPHPLSRSPPCRRLPAWSSVVFTS